MLLLLLLLRLWTVTSSVSSLSCHACSVPRHCCCYPELVWLLHQQGFLSLRVFINAHAVCFADPDDGKLQRAKFKLSWWQIQKCRLLLSSILPTFQLCVTDRHDIQHKRTGWKHQQILSWAKERVWVWLSCVCDGGHDHHWQPLEPNRRGYKRNIFNNFNSHITVAGMRDKDLERTKKKYWGNKN